MIPRYRVVIGRMEVSATRPPRPSLLIVPLIPALRLRRPERAPDRLFIIEANPLLWLSRPPPKDVLIPILISSLHYNTLSIFGKICTFLNVEKSLLNGRINLI
jgi:hypothetical protein